jgi:cytoskeletal protein RodZ
MSKRFLTILLFIGLFVVGASACQSKTTEDAQTTPPSTATATPTTEKVPTATATDEPTAAPTTRPTATSAPAKDDPTPTPGSATTATENPSPTPTRPWQIPEERKDDWTKGGESAGLIIVEYGDYQ